MHTSYAVAGHWEGGLDEAGLTAWAKALRAQLQAPKVSLGLVYLSPQYFEAAADILELLRLHAQIPLLLGCSSASHIAGSEEVEDQAGLSLGLYHLPGADLKAFHVTEETLAKGNGPDFWHRETGLTPAQVNGWLVFADPFHTDGEQWLEAWNEAYPGVPILGGLASGDPAEQRTQVYLNGEVFEEGGVALSVGGEVELLSVISQGCTPIGETWTITKTERNLIHEIGNRPAYEVLMETYNALSVEDQLKSRGNLFIGLVVNEYLEEFHRGDFLIRNILGADPRTGTLVVGAYARLGQTVQFQRRDAEAANEDMEALLERARTQLSGKTVLGGCLCSCNGRGARLFGRPNHDAALVQKRLGPLGISGFFCNGELGPVGRKNFVHGYTASLALFARKEDR